MVRRRIVLLLQKNVSQGNKDGQPPFGLVRPPPRRFSSQRSSITIPMATRSQSAMCPRRPPSTCATPSHCALSQDADTATTEITAPSRNCFHIMFPPGPFKSLWLSKRRGILKHLYTQFKG